ncbi:unnamed protein product [Protopolystoma xenopodis]|uniref:Uncharacterized protein n=1 Tax=Protopolystoma xenopodis TaxID=117903 RepID=A0A448WG23_9PLAT|nr:unnamed protein product [Protopolystoma xenopodis]
MVGRQSSFVFGVFTLRLHAKAVPKGTDENATKILYRPCKALPCECLVGLLKRHTGRPKRDGSLSEGIAPGSKYDCTGAIAGWLASRNKSSCGSFTPPAEIQLHLSP